MALQIPGWLPMSISAVPLPPDGPLPGLDVQLSLKIPANSDVQLHLPVVVGPVGYQSLVRVRCRFDVAGNLSHLSYDDPFTDNNDSIMMESDDDDTNSIKMEPDDAAMLPESLPAGNVKIKTESVSVEIKTEPVDAEVKMEPAIAEVKTECDVITLD